MTISALHFLEGPLRARFGAWPLVAQDPRLFALLAAVSKSGSDSRAGYFAAAGFELKADKTHVTEWDRLGAKTARGILELFSPGDPIWDEEFGGDRGGYLIDPVDGTRNFAFGFPIWGAMGCYAPVPSGATVGDPQICTHGRTRRGSREAQVIDLVDSSKLRWREYVSGVFLRPFSAD